MKIFDVELKLADHKDSTPQAQEAIFAHLPYWDRQDAVKQLQEALKVPVTAEPQPAATAAIATPDTSKGSKK